MLENSIRRKQYNLVTMQPVLDRNNCDYHHQSDWLPFQGNEIGTVTVQQAMEIEFYFKMYSQCEANNKFCSIMHV